MLYSWVINTLGMNPMKNLAVCAAVLSLAACGGGYDDIDSSRPGGGIGSTVTNPDNNNGDNGNNGGNDNNQFSDWKYGSQTEGSNTFSTRANVVSDNTFTVPTEPDFQKRVSVELQRVAIATGGIAETVIINTVEPVKCTPNCDVIIKFDGVINRYRMFQATDGVLKPLDTIVEDRLFNQFTTAKEAIVTLPFVSLPQPFEAKFNIKNYDVSKMMLTIEKTTSP